MRPLVSEVDGLKESNRGQAGNRMAGHALAPSAEIVAGASSCFRG